MCVCVCVINRRAVHLASLTKWSALRWGSPADCDRRASTKIETKSQAVRSGRWQTRAVGKLMHVSQTNNTWKFKNKKYNKNICSKRALSNSSRAELNTLTNKSEIKWQLNKMIEILRAVAWTSQVCALSL